MEYNIWHMSTKISIIHAHHVKSINELSTFAMFVEFKFPCRSMFIGVQIQIFFS